MIGKNLSEFISDLYYNPEIEFEYLSVRYIISGYINKDNMYTLETYSIAENKLIFVINDAIREKCVKAFETAQIFNNKTIYDVEKDITVLYG